MKYKLLAAVIAITSIPAYAVDGRVVDVSGKPVAGAKIDVVGTRVTIEADAQGVFTLADEGVHEIHVTAPGYSHQLLHLDDIGGSAGVTVTLNRSVIHQVDILGVPLHASVIESALPIAVLSGEQLRNAQAATLGDSLQYEMGVHSSFHGNVASTPIIRGLSGPRVLITQNSLDVSDASRVGPDHAVASEVSTAEQIEVLRGPATLFFGSGAIGGVVNVVDKRVPTDTVTEGEWMLSHESVNNQKLVSANLNSGKGNVAFHLDGFWRESEDYEVPLEPEQGHEQHDHDEHHHEYSVANTAEQAHGYTLGASYLLDRGYVGVSVGKLDRQYGIPGHAHGGDEPTADEAYVYADLEQDRFQLISELDFNNPWLRSIKTRAGFTDYKHAEIEAGELGTVFANKTSELRLDFLHQPFSDWKGGVVFDYKNTKLSAQGDEAFTPPSESETFAVAIMEERHLGDVLFQFGARTEHVTTEANEVLLPHVEFHSHEAEAEQEPEGAHEDHQEEDTAVYEIEQEFTPVSLSFGAVWDFTPGYNVAVSMSHSQRAPAASELFSFGPHIGTRSYEIGALFDLHNDDGEAHFELSKARLPMETSNNIDLSFRKYEGDVGILLNAFYNQVDDYYYQTFTGLYAESGHDHGDEANDENVLTQDMHEDGDHDEGAHDEGAHDEDLPVYLFRHDDAVLHGFEAQGIWQATKSLKTTVFSDYVRVELRDGGQYLPRIPPWRFGVRLDYQWQQVSANVSWTHVDEQKKLAPMETRTKGYNWLDATVTYHLPVASAQLALFVKAENLSDTEARVHTSFLKDIAPKPGRNISIGLRGTF